MAALCITDYDMDKKLGLQLCICDLGSYRLARCSITLFFRKKHGSVHKRIDMDKKQGFVAINSL